MKKSSFFVLVALCVTLSISAEPLTGFLGVSFGSSEADAKNVLSSRGYTNSKDGKESIVFYDVNFAGRASDIHLAFYNHKFYFGMVDIEADHNKALSSYRSMVDDMTTKYGTPQVDNEEYKSPYKKGDGSEEMALFANRATIYCLWVFNDDNYIIVNLRYDKPKAKNYITVSYTEKALMDLHLADQKSNNLGDL